MSSPDWRKTVARDGITDVRVRQNADGTASIKITSAAVSITASVGADDLAFLFAAPNEKRLDDTSIRSCLAPLCPHAQREAA
ncbi:MAG TPA: hypothetical protein VF503_08970 [Sphingobium sp.]|uniref:hypothetical protein n=1 Tax=Sphingobium sp. TaxID=1912891 RepID=UPI002ED39763